MITMLLLIASAPLAIPAWACAIGLGVCLCAVVVLRRKGRE